jgi:hypothetical protein
MSRSAWRAYPANAMSALGMHESDLKDLTRLSAFYFKAIYFGHKKTHIFMWAFCNLVRSGGFEPPTAWFVARYSIQLSYERKTDKLKIINNLSNFL